MSNKSKPWKQKLLITW